MCSEFYIYEDLGIFILLYDIRGCGLVIEKRYVIFYKRFGYLYIVFKDFFL